MSAPTAPCSRTCVNQPSWSSQKPEAPAVLYALFRIAQWAHNDLVAFLPSDHLISNDQVFMAHVNQALEGCCQRTDLMTLLGIPADCAELGYGWIEPGGPVAGSGTASSWWVALPPCWNSSSKPCRPSTRPLSQFDPHWERNALSAVSADLVVLPIRDVYWNDQGNTDRVIVPGFWRLRPVEKGRP